MNELALFAGAGGSCLWAELVGIRTVAAVEVSPYRREVLLRRQVDGMLPVFPIWDDVRTFDGRPWRGVVDIVTGGFPCQPFSTVGKRRGKDDPKNLWPHTIRIIREVRPPVAFLENVPGLLVLEYFGEVLGDLAEAGYDAEWMVLGADDLGATHRRKRLWILAYRDENRESELSRMLADLWRWARNGSAQVANPVQQSGGQFRKWEQTTAVNASEMVNSASQRRARGYQDSEHGEQVQDAPAQRKAMGDATGGRLQEIARYDFGVWKCPAKGCEKVGNTNCHGRDESTNGQPSTHDANRGAGRAQGWHDKIWPPAPSDSDAWRAILSERPDLAPAVDAESTVRRVVDGLAHRVDQLAALGDGWVPVVAAAAFWTLARRAGLVK